MDGSDAAALGLTQWLRAVWRWAVKVSTPPAYLPTPIVLRIGQFLDEDTAGHGWGVQQWLEAYTYVLQCTGETAEGRHWRPMGKGFSPKVLLLVEAFISVTGMLVAENCVMSCWNDPPEDLLCQRDEGAHAKVISYLDELAMYQPSRKAWDELVWLPASSVPHMLCQNEHVGYIQGHIVKLGLTMPPGFA